MVGIIFILHSFLQKIGLSEIRSNVVINYETVLSGGQQTSSTGKHFILTSIFFVVMISIGMLLPELLIEKKYRGEVTREEFLQLIEANFIDYDQDKITNLAENPDFVYIHSKAFYPRYYDPGEGEPGYNIEWLLANDYKNLGFMIVSPLTTGVTLEVDNPPKFFPHNVEVYIIGEWIKSDYVSKYLNAKAIFIPENEILITSTDTND
jgi:hypothetical protein